MSTRRREDYRLGPAVDPSKTWTSSDGQQPRPSEYDPTTVRRKQRSHTADESKDTKQYDTRPSQSHSSRTHRTTQDYQRTSTSVPPSSSQHATSSSRAARHGSQTVQYASSSNPYAGASHGQSTSQVQSRPPAPKHTNTTRSLSSRSLAEANDSTVRGHRQAATTTSQRVVPKQTVTTDDFGRTIRVKPSSRGTAQVTSQAFWTPPTENELASSRRGKERDGDHEPAKDRDKSKGAHQEKEKVNLKLSDASAEGVHSKSERETERGKREGDRSRIRVREERLKEHNWEERLREREREINRSKRSARQVDSSNDGAALQDYQKTLKAPTMRTAPSSSSHRRYRTEDGTAATATATNRYSRENADQSISNAPPTGPQVTTVLSGVREIEVPPPAPRFMPVYLPAKWQKSRRTHDDKYATQGGQSGSDTERPPIRHQSDKNPSNPAGYQSDGYTSGYTSGYASGKDKSQLRKETQPVSRGKLEYKYAPNPSEVPLSPPLITPGFVSTLLPSDNPTAKMTGPQMVSIRAGEGPADHQSHSILSKLQASLRHEKPSDFAPRILPTPVPSGTVVRDQRPEEISRNRAELPSFSQLRSESTRPNGSSRQVLAPTHNQTEPVPSRSQAYGGSTASTPAVPTKAPEQRDLPPPAPNPQHLYDVYLPKGVPEPVIPPSKHIDTLNSNTQATKLSSRATPSHLMPQANVQPTIPASTYPQSRAPADNLFDAVLSLPARMPSRYEQRPPPPAAMPTQTDLEPRKPKRTHSYEQNTQGNIAQLGRQYVADPLGFQSSRSTSHSSSNQHAGYTSAKSSRHTSPHNPPQQHPTSNHSTPSHDTSIRLPPGTSSISRSSSQQRADQSVHPSSSDPIHWSPHQTANAVDDRKVSSKVQDGPIQATWEVHAKHKLLGSNKESVVIGSLSVTSNSQQHAVPGTHPQLREILSNPPSSSTSPKDHAQEARSSPPQTWVAGAQPLQGIDNLPEISVTKATPGTAPKDLPRETNNSLLLPSVPPVPKYSTRNEARSQPGLYAQGVISQPMSHLTATQFLKTDEKNMTTQQTAHYEEASYSQPVPAGVDPKTILSGYGTGSRGHKRKGSDGTSGPSEAANASAAISGPSLSTQANRSLDDKTRKNGINAGPWDARVYHPHKSDGINAYVEEATDDEMPARSRNAEPASLSKPNSSEMQSLMQDTRNGKMNPPATEAAAYADYITRSFATLMSSPGAPALTTYSPGFMPPNALGQVPQSAPASQTAFQGYFPPQPSISQNVPNGVSQATVQATMPPKITATRSVTSPPVLSNRSATQASSKHASASDKHKKTGSRTTTGITSASETITRSSSKIRSDAEEDGHYTKGSIAKGQANLYESLRSAPIPSTRTNASQGYPTSNRYATSTQQPSYSSASAHQRSVSVPVNHTNPTIDSRPPSPTRQAQVAFPASSSSKPGPAKEAQRADKVILQVPAVAADGKLQVPSQVSRAYSNESDPLLTPSSISPPTPTAGQPDSRQRTVSIESKERKKQGFFGLFRSRSKSQDKRTEQPASATTKLPPAVRATEKLKPNATASEDARRRKAPDAHQLLTVPEPSRRSPPSRERKESFSNVFSPFKFLSSKKDRPMSSASLEALDGNTNATNTVIGTPTHSQVSQAPPIALPPSRDPMTATNEWRDREEYQRSRGRHAGRVLRPGVTFDVAEDPPPEKSSEKPTEKSSSNGKKGSKLVRRNTGKEKSRSS